MRLSEALLVGLICGYLILVSGCVSAHIVKEKERCEASYASVFKDMDGASMRGCGASGKADNSTANDRLLDLILKGLAQ